MPRLLVVSYYFPPIIGIGVERTLKHVTYLPDFGWQAGVVTVRDAANQMVDAESLSRIPPGTDVQRAGVFEPAHLRAALRSMVARSPRTSAHRPSPGAVGAARPGLAGRARGLANAAWARAIPLLFFPDDQVSWIPGAVRAGVRAHRKRPVDAVFSSSSPVSSHLAAGLIAGRIERPWIADFRDPWVGNAFVTRRPALYRAIDRRLEHWVVRRAARVVVATAQMRANYAARYPTFASKIVHLPNGYDLADLREGDTTGPERASDGTYHIAYTGSVYGDQELSLFLDGVEMLLDRRPDLRDRLRVVFVGWLSAANQELARRRLPVLDPVVRHHGYVPRAQATAIQRAADAGLVLLSGQGDRSLFATSKLYEYLGLDLPVLAVVPPGEVRQILGDLHWGVVADPTPDGVAEGLERIMAMRPPDRPADPERRYERRTLSAALAHLLDEVTDGAEPRGQ